MTNKRKNRARSIQAKTGMSYAAAINVMNQAISTWPHEGRPPPHPPNLAKLGPVTPKRPPTAKERQALAKLDEELGEALREIGEGSDTEVSEEDTTDPKVFGVDVNNDAAYVQALREQRKDQTTVRLVAGQVSKNVRPYRPATLRDIFWIDFENLKDEDFTLFHKQNFIGWWELESPDINEAGTLAGLSEEELKKVNETVFEQRVS